MHCLFRFLLLLIFCSLATLAVWPYLPKIQEEALHFYQAWEQIKQTKEKTNISSNQQREAQVEKPIENPARRELAQPEAISESPQAIPTTDPFILETRRRAEEDPEAAMRWLQSQDARTDQLRGMLEVVALWAAEDSESALLWLESNAQGLARIETLQSGINLWAGTAPEAAADWIDGMASDGSKLTASNSLASKWVESDPQAAAKWVSGLPSGPIRHEATRALTSAWLKQDPQSASIWAFQEAEFNGDYELLDETIRAFSKQSPEDAEAIVREMVIANHSSGAGVDAHIRGRAEQNPVATAQWLANLLPSDPIYSEENNSRLMQVWAESDSIAASEWLNQMSAGPQKDAAIEGFSKSIERFEPEVAAIWANSIGEPTRRIERLEASLRNWADARPVDALKWLESAEMDPSLREQLIREIPRY